MLSISVASRSSLNAPKKITQDEAKKIKFASNFIKVRSPFSSVFFNEVRMSIFSFSLSTKIRSCNIEKWIPHRIWDTFLNDFLIFFQIGFK